MNHNKLPLSVSIISYNEEDNLSRTLDAVSDIASEIIIVDSHSTDNTKQIALKYNAKFFEEDWKGHVAQKNSSLDKCSQPWILCLDCDEVVTPKLLNSIAEAIRNGKSNGYSINRKTFYLGKLLQYAWQPDWNLRLVKKSAHPVWQGLDPHDYLTGEGRIEKLKGDLLHYSFTGIKHHFTKTIDYARISAISYAKSGKTFSIFNLIINPTIAFLKLFIIHLGFLDGVRGLLAATGSAFGTFLKYAFIFENELKKRKNTG